MNDELERFLGKITDVTSKLREKNLLKANQGGSATGAPGHAMQDRLRMMFSMVSEATNFDFDFGRLLNMDVGDRNINMAGGMNDYNIATSVPVAPDVWYLTISPSVLPFKGDGYQADADLVKETLKDFFASLKEIRPLLSIQSYSDIRKPMNWWASSQFFDVSGVSVIREMRFETWMLNRNTEFPSVGTKNSSEAGVTRTPSTSEGQLYAGMLVFPVGQPGVMEVLSLWSETIPQMIIDDVEFTTRCTIHPADDQWNPIFSTDSKSLEGMMSPMTDMQGKCPGVHLVERGYLPVNRDIEYPAKPMEGKEPTSPLLQMRYYLRRDAKWPLPGEFIGLIAKPWPTHVWWFQESCPMLYAGNWVETNHYTSGIVKEILPQVEGKYGNLYKVYVRGVEVVMESSDFLEYAVGDRVAIIRLGDLGRFTDPVKGNFKWDELEDMIARAKAEKEIPSDTGYVVNPNMMIVPMSFYEEQGG